MNELRDSVNKKLISKIGNSILPTTIKGILETDWFAFNRFSPVELGTSILIWGASQSGKSLMMMKLGASVQEKGGLFICFNTEAANRDSEHLSRVIPSLKYDDILFYQPDYIEHTIDSIHTIIDTIERDSPPIFIAIDSINSCPTKNEMETGGFKSKDMSGAEIAGIWSSALRQLTSKLSKKPVVLCLISQTRTGGIGGYRTKEVSSGGAAPFFYATTVIKTFGRGALYEEEGGGYTTKQKHPLQEKAAQECSLKLEKSRFSSGGSTLDYIIDFKKGICQYEGLIDMLIFYNIIEVKGAWYYYGETKLGQGRLTAKETIITDKKLLKELIKKLG